MAFSLAAGMIAATPALAQRVPGRELLDFPLGSLAEPPALSVEAGDGFRNPASLLIGRPGKFRLVTSALLSPPEQGVSAQLVALSYALPPGTTVGVSVVRAAVDGLVETIDSPDAVGGEVPYGTFVLSASAAHKYARNVASGVALRYRSGQLAESRRGALGLDAGVIADRITRRDLRVGFSSFLWRPGDGGGSEASYAVAGDGRLAGPDSLHSARAGYSFTATGSREREHYVYASGRYEIWEVRGGVARARVAGEASTRLRLSIGLHYARYTIGVARDENIGHVAPSYQFTLSTLLP